MGALSDLDGLKGCECEYGEWRRVGGRLFEGVGKEECVDVWWSGVGEDGSGEVGSVFFFSFLPDWQTDHIKPSPFKNSSNPTSPGWSFVETEDWRADLEAGWAENGTGHDDSTFCFLFPPPLFPFTLSMVVPSSIAFMKTNVINPIDRSIILGRDRHSTRCVIPPIRPLLCSILHHPTLHTFSHIHRTCALYTTTLIILI